MKDLILGSFKHREYKKAEDLFDSITVEDKKMFDSIDKYKASLLLSEIK